MTTKSVTPVFTAGQYSKDDVVRLIGKIDINETKTKVRIIMGQHMTTLSSSTSVGSTSTQETRQT
jgi:hypothetical protein